jgi:hypothetical protein
VICTLATQLRFQIGSRKESEIEDIHDRLLAEIMVDAEDRVLLEHRQRDFIERPCRSQVATERLFNDDARLIGQAGGAEAFDHRGEQRRGNCKIMCRAFGLAQNLLQRIESRRVAVIAAHILKQ